MLNSYSQPPPFTWPSITPRALLPVFPPPEPLIKPDLPSPAREPAFDAPYTLSTHIFPTAHLRTTEFVPLPSPLPANATKPERQAYANKTLQELKSLRISLDPKGVQQVLWNCANRYVRKDLVGRSRGITLFFAHANGFPKEVSRPIRAHTLIC